MVITYRLFVTYLVGNIGFSIQWSLNEILKSLRNRSKTLGLLNRSSETGQGEKQFVAY